MRILWLWPFCVTITETYITCLTASFNCLCAHPSTLMFWLFIFWTIIILAVFKSIISQCRCSLEPKEGFGGFKHPPDPSTLLVLTTLACCSLCLLFCRLCFLQGSCLSEVLRRIWAGQFLENIYWPRKKLVFLKEKYHVEIPGEIN